MRKAFLLTALAGASLVATGPALAQRGGGHGGGHGGGLGASMSGGLGAQAGRGHSVEARGRVDANVRSDRNLDIPSRTEIDTGTRLGVRSRAARSARIENREERLENRQEHLVNGLDTRAEARVNSQGPFNASATAIANADENSVLAQFATDLPGLSTGLTVQNSAGVEIGTVSQIVTGSDGQVRMVFVTDTDGNVIRLAPTTLTVDGDFVTAATVD